MLEFHRNTQTRRVFAVLSWLFRLYARVVHRVECVTVRPFDPLFEKGIETLIHEFPKREPLCIKHGMTESEFRMLVASAVRPRLVDGAAEMDLLLDQTGDIVALTVCEDACGPPVGYSDDDVQSTSSASLASVIEECERVVAKYGESIGPRRALHIMFCVSMSKGKAWILNWYGWFFRRGTNNVVLTTANPVAVRRMKDHCHRVSTLHTRELDDDELVVLENVVFGFRE